MFRTETSNYVPAFELCAIPTGEHCILSLNSGTKLTELGHYPLATEVVSLRVHSALAKAALLCRKSIGRIGTESRTYKGYCVRFCSRLRRILA